MLSFLLQRRSRPVFIPVGLSSAALLLLAAVMFMVLLGVVLWAWHVPSQRASQLSLQADGVQFEREFAAALRRIRTRRTPQ
jgi:hypothetical protein